MNEDFKKLTEDRLKAKFASTLFGELDSLTELERQTEQQIERLQAELEAVRSQKHKVVTIIKSAGIERTGSTDQTEPPNTQSPISVSTNPANEGRTHKEMILAVISEAGDQGLRPVEIAAQVQRRFNRNITVGLHTQIARLRKDGTISKHGGAWKLAQKNAGP
ncbi:MAG: hypothetical protein ACK4SQ_10505 [Allorhizobium sp.]